MGWEYGVLDDISLPKSHGGGVVDSIVIDGSAYVYISTRACLCVCVCMSECLSPRSPQSLSKLRKD